MGKTYYLARLVFAFLVSACVVTAIGPEKNAAAGKHINNFTRRECVEAYDANGHQIIDEDGEPQFNCDLYFPTTQAIQARIASTGLVNDPTKIPAYYTGWSHNEVEGELGGWISVWMEDYLARRPSPQPQATGYYWWWTAVPREWWCAQNTWFVNHQGDGPEFIFPPKMSNIFDACISESLATMNVGKEIFLFVPSEYVLGSEPSRQWWSIEYPLLTSNAAVETIYRIDPRPAADGRLCGERVIWVKQFKSHQQTWFCEGTARSLPPPPPPPLAPAKDSSSQSVARASFNNNDHNRLFRRECWAEEDLEGNWEYDAKQCDDYMPILGQCQAGLKQDGHIDDPSYIPVYYTGWPAGIDFADVTLWMAAYMEFYITHKSEPKPKGWYWYWSVLIPNWYTIQQKYLADNFARLKNINLDSASITKDNIQEIFTTCLCEALAASCVSSTVILMVPFDYVLGSEPTRHWWSIEFGALTKNPNVQKIYRVDPSPMETLIDLESKCVDPGRWVPLLMWQRGMNPEFPQKLACGTFLTDANAPPHPVVPPPPSPSLLFGRDTQHVVESNTNGTHFNQLSRRECVGTTDIMTGDTQYLPENCDNMAPTLALCLEHWNQKLDNGVVTMTDPTKLPIYYTGWPPDLDSGDLFKWISAFTTNYIKVQNDPKETGWYWFWNTFDRDWYEVQEAYLEANQDKIQNIKPKGEGQDIGAILDGCMNEAFATSCIYPKVFLMVPHDYTLGSQKSRHWWSIEFGALTKNPNVQEIFRVDPRPDQTDDECTGYAPVLIWSREAGDEEHPQDFFCDVFVSDTPITNPPGLNQPEILMKRSHLSDSDSQIIEVNKWLIADSGPNGSPEGLNVTSDGSKLTDTNRKLHRANKRLFQKFETSNIAKKQASSPHFLEKGSATAKRSTTEAAVIWSSTSKKRLTRRQCTERTPGQVDTRWDCDLNLPTLQQLVTEIQVNGLTSQEDTYAVYFTGFDNNDVVIGRLKGSIAAWMKWYMQCILETHQLDGISGTKYWYWYFDVVYDRDGSWFAAQEEWIEMHSPPNAMDDEEIYFSEEAPLWFGKCTSQAYAAACEQATVILFAPHDLVLADHPNRHFYGIEYGVLTRNPKVQRVIRADPTPPEDPNQPRSMPTIIWERANPAMNDQIPQVFDCEDAIGQPQPSSGSTSQGDEDGEDDEMLFDMDLGAG